MATIPLTWTIARMRRIISAWALLELADKNYILRRIRDEEPETFYRIAEEKLK